ncbi:PfkB family carbohydrate kinase [Nonomuraea cavernae]|uniref:PfkB family carbohydrate kinase n=1 Tax=Nonomuraea cavernae TaxID=2045107 RepID=UPI0033D918FB
MKGDLRWSPDESRALRETAARARVLVIGSLNVDQIINTDAEPPDEGAVLVRSSSLRVGGHAGNCASALAALGISVSVLAAVGADADGDLLLDDLRTRGIDVSGVARFAGAPTGRVIIPVFGEKHYMLLLRGANDLLTLSAVSTPLTGYDAVLVFDPSLAVLEEIAPLVDGPLLCWTPGGVYSGDPVAKTVLPHCDVVFANRAEYDALRRTVPWIDDPHLRAELVVTSGRDGSSVRHRGTEQAVPARPVPVVDPTGAGDAFAATYLLARLAGLAPARRLGAANLSGALAVGAVGARARLATLTDLLTTSSIKEFS